MNYSAPVLIALFNNKQERLEAFQNNAMRTMLEAPRWCNACVMQTETRLVPLTTRVEYITVYRVARILNRDVEGVAQRRLQLAMTQGTEYLNNNTLLINITLATHSLIQEGNGLWRKADVPTPTYSALPP